MIAQNYQCVIIYALYVIELLKILHKEGKRLQVETLFGKLKSAFSLEHSRHRSLFGIGNTYLARPHEMGVSKIIPQTDYIKATILHINLAGLYIKLELQCETGRILQVDLSEAVFQSLKLQKAEQVYIYPLKSTIFE